MKIGWIVAGKTFEHKGELFAMGLHWNGTLKVWHGMVREAGHCRATFEKEKAKLESLEGLVFDFVDYDCMRPGNEKWFEEEAKKIIKKAKAEAKKKRQQPEAKHKLTTEQVLKTLDVLQYLWDYRELLPCERDAEINEVMEGLKSLLPREATQPITVLKEPTRLAGYRNSSTNENDTVICPRCNEQALEGDMTKYNDERMCEGCAESLDATENFDDPHGKDWR